MPEICSLFDTLHTVENPASVSASVQTIVTQRRRIVSLPQRTCHMTTVGTPRPPDWKDLYQLAVIELDPAKLSHRISDARNAILDRIQETISVAAHYRERQELTDALNGLRLLRQEYERRVQQFGEPRTLRRKMG